MSFTKENIYILVLAAVLLLAGTAGAQTPAMPGTGIPAGEQPSNQQAPGSITGTVVDQSGALVAGAKVKIARGDQPLSSEIVSDDGGQFSFPNVSPGPFQLTVTSEGFRTQTFSGILYPGEICVVPQIAMTVATAMTEVEVTVPAAEVAEVEIQEEEKQRVLGVIPNFYVSYVPDAVPLTVSQKFDLAWKTTRDPVNFGLTAAVAGIQQATNQFSGYGPGAQGYAKRYGASFADSAVATFIGSAILPSLFRQDPRYFYKGVGSARSRFLYAIANAVICKGDNRRWQANYSNILGNVAAGGISNLYYPSTDRNGVALTFENALIGIGASAAGNILQEFIIRKLTPGIFNHDPTKS